MYIILHSLLRYRLCTIHTYFLYEWSIMKFENTHTSKKNSYNSNYIINSLEIWLNSISNTMLVFYEYENSYNCRQKIQVGFIYKTRGGTVQTKIERYIKNDCLMKSSIEYKLKEKLFKYEYSNNRWSVIYFYIQWWHMKVEWNVWDLI